jgi:lactoylglutathione lyase
MRRTIRMALRADQQELGQEPGMQLLVNIDVADLAGAERFYGAAFGLAAVRRFGDDGVELGGAQVPVFLLRKPQGSTAAAGSERDYARHWTPIHCDVVVDDLDAALVRAIAAGAVQEGVTREAAWGRIVQIADPFGHGWCLLQFQGRGYDEIATA